MLSVCACVRDAGRPALPRRALLPTVESRRRRPRFGRGAQKMGTDNSDKMDLGADATSVGLKASSADAEKTTVSYAVQVGEQQALAKSGQLEGALQNLLALEKPARLVRAS